LGWRAARSVHDPGKTVLDLAVGIALGGVRGRYRRGPRREWAVRSVASDPTVCRLIDALAEQPAKAISAIRAARARGPGAGLVTPLPVRLAWTQLLAWGDQPARLREPKRMRLRLFAVAGRVITTGRRQVLRLARRWPWADLVVGGHRRLAALP